MAKANAARRTTLVPLLTAFGDRDAALRDRDREIESLAAALGDRDREIESLAAAVDDKGREIESLKREIESLASALRGKEREVESLTEESLAELHSKELEIEAIRASTSWRMTAPVRWFLDLLRGNGSPS